LEQRLFDDKFSGHYPRPPHEFSQACRAQGGRELHETRLTLRKAKAADAGDISACVRRAYERFERRLGCSPAPMLQDYRRVIASALVWVAVVGDRVLGVLVLSHRSRGMLLENVAVDPQAQGQGVGKQLLLLAERLAREAGYQFLDLYTNVLMVENRVLYGRFGYREYDTRQEDGFTRVYMRKALTASPQA
jgi:GNAT superfamily N-acetyltransferase